MAAHPAAVQHVPHLHAVVHLANRPAVHQAAAHVGLQRAVGHHAGQRVVLLADVVLQQVVHLAVALQQAVQHWHQPMLMQAEKLQVSKMLRHLQPTIAEQLLRLQTKPHLLRKLQLRALKPKTLQDTANPAHNCDRWQNPFVEFERRRHDAVFFCNQNQQAAALPGC